MVPNVKIDQTQPSENIDEKRTQCAPQIRPEVGLWVDSANRAGYPLLMVF